MLSCYERYFFASFILLLLPLLAEAQPKFIYTDNVIFNPPSNVENGYADNARLQSALSYCSMNGIACIIPANKTYEITTDLFIWGDASLLGGGPDAKIIFKPMDGGRSLLQVGIIPKDYDNPPYPLPINYDKTLHTVPYKKEPTLPSQSRLPFTGKISGLVLEIHPSITKDSVINDYKAYKDRDVGDRLIFRSTGENNRLIYFWQVDGGELSNNRINLNSSMYGATSAGNNDNYVKGGEKLVRQNIRIVNNVITSGDYVRAKGELKSEFKGIGNEGIGLGDFNSYTGYNGAFIAYNTITGVGDDAIGLHGVDNALVEQNYVDSTDGRIFIAESRCVAVLYNDIFRLPLFDEKITASGSIGFTRNGKSNPKRPPTQVIVHGNRITIPQGAKSDLGAISLKSGRAVSISNNTYYNKSPTSRAIGLTIAYDDRNSDNYLEFEKYFILGQKDPAIYSGCFKNDKTKLPDGLRFLSIADDNYDATFKAGSAANEPALDYFPVKSIEVKNNNFAPGGEKYEGVIGTGSGTSSYISNSVEVNTYGNWRNLFGHLTSKGCSSTQIVGFNNTCHSMSFIDNQLKYLPWQTCQATFISNMPEKITEIPDTSTCPPNEIDRLKAPAAIPSQEKIYYGINTTVKIPLEPVRTIPGIVEAEDFSSSNYAPTGVGREFCDGNKPGVFKTTDITGVCDVAFRPGGKFEYKIDVLEDGKYTLIARAGASEHGSRLHVRIDSSDEAVNVVTNGMSHYSDNRVGDFNLTKGQHLVTLWSDVENGNLNLNYLKFQIFRDCVASLACVPTVKASSIEGDSLAKFDPKYVVDVDLPYPYKKTRWSSKFSDPQWIQLDLGSITPITSITLAWELASAKNYTLEVSDDSLKWRTIITKTGLTGGTYERTDKFTGLQEYARYVRMVGTARTNPYSYSLYSFKVNSN